MDIGQPGNDATQVRRLRDIVHRDDHAEQGQARADQEQRAGAQ